MSTPELPLFEDPETRVTHTADEPSNEIALSAGVSGSDSGRRLIGDVGDGGFGEDAVVSSEDETVVAQAGDDLGKEAIEAEPAIPRQPEAPLHGRLQVTERSAPPDTDDTRAVVDGIAHRTPPDEVRQAIAGVATRFWRDPNDFAQQLEAKGNEAYGAVAPVQIVHVPAAVDRETQLDVTMEQIKRQHDEAPGPVAVVVSANYLASRAETKAAVIRANLDTIQDAERTYSDMPMSHYVTAYPPETSIGTIREHVLDASVLSYGRQMEQTQAPPRDILLSGWDADTLRADSGFFAGMQEKYAQSQARAWAAYPEYVLHSHLDAEQFPRINLLIDWLNLGTQHGVVEVAQQQFTLNLGAYGPSDGYQSAANGEQTNLWVNAEHRSGYNAELVALKGTTAVVSSRRLVSHMCAGGHVGYSRLTNSTEVPVEPQEDIAESLYANSLYRVLDYSLWQVVEGKREELIFTGGMSYDDARKAATEHAKGVFHGQANIRGASSDVHRAIDEVADGIYDPFAHRAYLQR